jgi:hypothetical protein
MIEKRASEPYARMLSGKGRIPHRSDDVNSLTAGVCC